MGVDDDRDGHEGVQYLGWSYEGSWNDGQQAGGHNSLHSPEQGVAGCSGSHAGRTHGDLAHDGLHKQSRITI